MSHVENECSLSIEFNYLIKMTDRDVNRNYHDENGIFHGFTPLWALVLFSIAIIFLTISIVGSICHLAGCQRQRQDQTNNIYSTSLKQPSLTEHSHLQVTSIKSTHF
ncbi:unnamed protein product [Rotaria socialis]|uniref:Uncharacterized protein n=1 Tax=Rotaria socialis TaxID=392032 RepID=A0A819X4D3_9BILA|nr:unnamed protein product [Rotaria socialis]CAF3330151.1 unnamed protein product [Rotaria socialis]CAF3342441.1 unnamed protein product [Rotaria socialis]CAF3361933.1 unnamed protein product [Rotaria socialis]CAF3610538.1 unnamed protein product [Rotaria socialis]